MNEPSPRHILHLIVEGFPAEKAAELSASSGAHDRVEVFPLTESNAKDALERIFAADTVAVWGKTE